MGLFDRFRRKAVKASSTPSELLDVYAQLGALSVDAETTKARLEALKTEWIGMRDELRRLAQRLEKRDERAAKRESAELSAELELEPAGFDPLEAQRELRRRKNGVLRAPGTG